MFSGISGNNQNLYLFVFISINYYLREIQYVQAFVGIGGQAGVFPSAWDQGLAWRCSILFCHISGTRGVLGGGWVRRVGGTCTIQK